MNINVGIEAIKSLIAARATAIVNSDAEAAIESFARDIVLYDLQPPLAFAGAKARDVEELCAWLKTWKSAKDTCNCGFAPPSYSCAPTRAGPLPTNTTQCQ